MSEMASTYLNVFLAAVALANFICFLLVLVKMFAHEYVAMAIICVLLGCGGIGGLIAFIFGWSKAEEWQMSTLMTVWTMAVVALIAFCGGTTLMGK